MEKQHKIQKIFEIGQLTWKLNEAISSKIWIESKQTKIN